MTHKTKYIIWEPLLLALMVVLGMLLGKTVFKPSHQKSGDSIELGSTEEILRYIENKYVDDVDRERLQTIAINAILEELDPHSKFISASEVDKIKAEMEGAYLGYGITWMTTGDSSLLVSQVANESSAEKAGIRPGYSLLKLDTFDQNTYNLSLFELDSIVRSSKPNPLVLKLIDLEGETQDFSLERSPVYLPSVASSFMLNDSIGYIALDRFSGKTYKEFMGALELLKEEELDDLIIDLRGNPGGYLQETVKIVSQFINQNGELLVYTKGRKAKQKEYKSNGRIFHQVDDIVLLIDEESASASEILAGSLQDLDRAIVIGRRSFGKGLVQEQYDLINGGAVRLTTARYYVPSGRLIQKSYADDQEYRLDLQQRSERGEYSTSATLTYPDSLTYYTASGRPVYGGGGITPDLFMPKELAFDYENWPYIRRYLREQAMVFFTENNTDLPKDPDGWSRYNSGSSEILANFILSLATGEELPSLLSEAQKKAVEEEIINTLLVLQSNDPALPTKLFWKKDNDIMQGIGIIEQGEVDGYLGVPSQAILE